MDNLKFLRDKMGLTQESLADKMNVSQQSVAKWETGQAMPRADKLPELARILGCDVSELFKKEVG